MNENEKKFMKDLRDAEANIYAPYEMEIDHCQDEDNPNLDGWYVYKYNEERGEAIPDDNCYEPILTDVDAEKLNIDVIKCLHEYGCYYVA